MFRYILAFSAIALIMEQSQSVFKEVTLTPENTAQSGANITATGASNEIIIPNGQWHITTIGHATWHLVTHLDNSWGFHPNEESNITLEIDGVMADNLIFAFTTPILQNYIAIRHSTGRRNRMVPRSDGYCPPSISDPPLDLSGDITTVLGQSACTNRICDFGGFNSFDNTDLLNVIKDGTDPKAFPVKFTLINKPTTMDDSLMFRFQSAGASASVFSEYCVYQSFEADEGLKIYFAVDDRTETCSVKSLKITYSVDIPTTTTAIPSNSPIQDTFIQTSHYPTNTPSVSPTQPPTAFPSSPSPTAFHIPSSSPTASPSSVDLSSSPSSYPTRYPSVNPILPSIIQNNPTETTTPVITQISTMTPGSETSLLSNTNSTEIQLKKDKDIFWTIAKLAVAILSALICICCYLTVRTLWKGKQSQENTISEPGRTSFRDVERVQSIKLIGVESHLSDL